MSKSLSILITGATTGIGRHAALYLASKGHHVIASGRKADLLADLAAEATRAGLRLDTVRLDVTDARSIDEAVAQVDRLTGGRGIDGLVNNAGYGQPGPLIEVSDAELRQQFETNVFGLMAVTRAFLPQLRGRRGRLVNVSSVGGRVTFPLFGAYHGSKYAVEAFSDALRNELAPFGMKVVVIEPGPIRSEFGDRALAAAQSFAKPSSPYAPVIARAEEIKAITDKQSASPEVVSRAMERALTSSRPAHRYVVPFTSRLMVFLMRVLPVRWTDSLVRRLAGLTPARLNLLPAAR
jgi:NAD(P)-dependent dehydrogenase (short-subunit alcohol dehydrogenase family)